MELTGKDVILAGMGKVALVGVCRLRELNFAATDPVLAIVAASFDAVVGPALHPLLDRLAAGVGEGWWRTGNST